MRNFSRTLRLGLRYRWTLAGAMICSLLVALMWGGNIGAIYPIVEVVFKGDSLHEWVDEKIDSSQSQLRQLATDVKRLESQAAPSDRSDPEQSKADLNLALARSQYETEQSALARYEQLRPYIKAYAPNGPFQTLVLVIGLLVLGTLIKDLFLVASTILVERVAQMAAFDLRKAFYRRTLQMDLTAFGESSNSDLISRFTSNLSAVTMGVQIFYGRAVREPLKMIVCLVAAAWICWRLLVFSLIVAPVALWLISRLARSLRRASRRAMEEMSQLYGVLTETFVGIKIVKAFTMERYERRRFHETSKQFYRKAMKIARYNALVRPVTELAGVGMISMAVLAGAYLVLNQQTHLLGIRMSYTVLSEAELLLFYAMLAGVSDPARKLADAFGHLQRATAAADRVYEMYDRQPSVADPQVAVSMPRHRKSITLTDVYFSYQSEQPVLRGIDLTIPFGETLAIVGPNGCGKSTLAHLILRFYDPVSGSVKIDGVDLRDVRRRDLRRQMGLVTQEPMLFDDTVLHNIRYGTPQSTREQAVEAAQAAHADRFITERLERGYDTPVGAGGNRLSGGQRQRIALARAILRDPSVLILDEATSQIDLESEQLIQRVLGEFIKDRTTIIITHRMGTLALADRILVMELGRIKDLGTHDELLERCDLYQRLYRIEFRKSA